MSSDEKPPETTVGVKVMAHEYEKAPADDYVPVEHLVPYARNSRTHSKVQIKQIAAAFIEFGVTSSALYDAESLAHGHGRVLAAELIYSQGKQLFHAPGEKAGGAPIPIGTFPAKRCDGWSKAQKQAYIIADNNLALNAGWDTELLALEFADIEDAGMSLDILGFDEDALAGILGNPEDSEEKEKTTEEIGGDRFLLLIECRDEGQQAALYAEFQERELKCKLS